MAEQNAAYVATIAVNYDRYLGPLFFCGFADEMVALLDVHPGMRVLETACGTGLVTERLLARLGGDGHLVATDLNEPMLAHAQSKGLPGKHLEWRQADATKLPFPDSSFHGKATGHAPRDQGGHRQESGCGARRSTLARSATRRVPLRTATRTLPSRS